MKIVHICLSVYFVDHFRYQENFLIQKNVSHGHDVIVIASTETFDKSGNRVYCLSSKYIGQYGVPVYRVPFFFGNNFFSHKLRKYKGVRVILEKFQPDVIFFHGGCAWEVMSVARFVKENSSVRFFIDSHEDYNNSARNWLSREILHRCFYRPILRSAMGVCEKLLCVSTESIDFMREFYGIPVNMLELYPLGGEPLNDDEYERRRSSKRRSLGVSDKTRIFIQTGKQTGKKRLIDSLLAFRNSTCGDCLFLIAGSLSSCIRSDVLALVDADPRIHFLDWCSPEELTDVLCAADIYVQPGSQSSTMQHSLCCRCAVILADVQAHQFYKCDNGWYINNDYELHKAFREACCADLNKLKSQSFAFALNYLDYEILSKRYCDEKPL
jgi:1,2-diacylglycerol 3-alpha-glucosyltransferase